MAQLDLWPEDVAALPWGGRSPRLLAQGLVAERLKKFLAMAPCGVDKSVVRCPRREPLRTYVDSAQFQLCVSTSFQGGQDG